MKKLILLIFALCFIPIQAFAYTCTAVLTGNASNVLTWAGSCNSTTPQNGDTIDLNGYVVVWDSGAGATLPATGTFVKIYDATGGTGNMTLALGSSFCNSGCALSATTIQAGTKPTVTGLIQVTGTTSNVLTINTGLNANAAGIIGGTNTSAAAINLLGTGTITINGDVTGGTAINTYGVNNSAAGTVNITGNLVATAYTAFYNAGIGAVSVTGNITGGTALTAYGFNNLSTGTVNVTGIITGGTANSATGFFNNSTGHVTLGAGSNLVQGTYGGAYAGYAPAWTSSLLNRRGNYVGTSFGQAANTDFPQQLPANDIKSGITSGTVTGTYNPATAHATSY